MENLNPQLSAALAGGVYALAKADTLQKAISELNLLFGNILSFSEDALLKAKTGGPWFIKCRTAFGFTLLGKGQLQGHAFFIFRGTQYLADWLTNLNVIASRSASGQPVHDGFNLSFASMKVALTEFMCVVAKEGIAHIHCIGHSLGGALATLCSEWIRSSYNRQVFLYTYGSPRVGLYDFAHYCTTQVGSENIFRAYHKTDIVPFIPVWPFIHTPNSGQDYYLPSPGIVPMAEYHAMGRYIDSVRGKPWSAFASLTSEKKSDDGIVFWLKQSTPAGLTITSLQWLYQALVYVLDRCMNAAAKLISRTFGTSFTLMDQLAYILNKSIDISQDVSSLMQLFIRKIMQILGMHGAVEKIDFTREFIRSLLLRLQQKANEYTQSVLNKILVEGRAI